MSLAREREGEREREREDVVEVKKMCPHVQRVPCPWFELVFALVIVEWERGRKKHKNTPYGYGLW